MISNSRANGNTAQGENVLPWEVVETLLGLSIPGLVSPTSEMLWLQDRQGPKNGDLLSGHEDLFGSNPAPTTGDYRSLTKTAGTASM